LSDKNRPITKKGWFWGVVGGGVVLVAGAVILGVVLGTSSADSTTTLSPASFR